MPRKKARSEVEILEARLESIESAYSERLKQMEDLLNRVMPGVSAQELSSGIIPQPTGSASGSNTGSTSKTTPSENISGASTKAVSSTAGTKRSSPSTTDPSERHVPNLERHRSTTLSMGSPTSSIASSLKSSPEIDDESRNDGDPGGLAATMDKLRLFDASLYYGKGSIFFTSTDKNHFWDEEISFDVHDVHDIEIPPEATIMPPVEAIDMLFDIYYSAMLMAADLGLHRKCDRWIPDKQVQETRKRVFWCVYAMDSITASITGRRPLIDDNEIDVPMLAPITGEGEVEYSNALFLIHVCKLWRIFRNVKRYIFNAVEVQEMVPGSLPKSYEQQLIQWQLQLPAVLRFSFDVKPDDMAAMYNARAGKLLMLYESTLIMLHKPYLTSGAHVEHQHDRSRDICIKAASKITDMNRILNTTYIRTFDITGVPEYAIVNAVRIQVMYMNSDDPSIAEVNTHNFDYLMTFFLEYYSSPRANYDEQTINCILTFFDEFMHSVKGLSDSAVHMCECAIKNLALAKRARINSSRQHGGVVAERDPRNLSKLVRIGKEEHERELAWSASSPSSPHQRDMNSVKKRHSHKPHQSGGGQHRESPGKHSPYQPNEDVLDSASSTTAKSDTHVVHSGLEGYLHPGKFQKVSQYVGPFGGPEVMESLNIYQTSNAILNQPPTSNLFSMPMTANMMSSPVDMYHHSIPVQSNDQQQGQQQQQQQQQFFGQVNGQSIDTMNAFDPSFWNDLPASAFQADAQILNQNIMEGSLGQQDTNMAITQGGSNAMPEGDNPMFGHPELWSGPSEHVKVYVRVRPPNEREQATELAQAPLSQGVISTVNIIHPNQVVITGPNKNDTSFMYDCVGAETTTQEQVFNDVGRSIVEQCVRGYNGTIFAYGQTGSGKTYTMQGPTSIISVGNHPLRGIIPRCLEYLFELIATEEQMDSSVKYLCKASYIEIYNEAIFDLLDSSATSRSIREDIKRGLFEQGAYSRHTSATAMNAESSRSHTVLTLTIQSMALVDGINHIRESRFNLVDLAGSERQKLANTEGQRLKEAGNINKSLSCLGSVINALGEIAAGHSRYVHYRDSRLTFLLKDSLGGNSNTFIVANISPSALCYQESLSTLRFAQRAKMIKNKAVVNEDIQGNVNELRAEIQRLKAELALERPGGVEDKTVTNKLLLETLTRLRTEQAEHATTAQKAYQLDDACKAREKQVQSANLVTKFKESALLAYRKGNTSSAFESEKAALREEVSQLKRQLDFHPETLKVKAENMSLREMLQKYEKYQAGLEEQEEAQKKNKEYFHNLSSKIIEQEEELDTLRLELQTLRARHGTATPFDITEDIDFPKIEGIDDLMQESPPKVQDGYRRFSSDVKSLFQRVTKSRQAEYRRLSGNLGLGKPGQSLLDSDIEAKTPSSGSTVRSRRSGPWLDETDGGSGENLSDSISAKSTMHSDDTVEMTLLKRDIDRLKDENSVLAEDKIKIEEEVADKEFQLMTMEKCLEEATSQAELYGQQLQESQANCVALDEKVVQLCKEQGEHMELMETMRQESLQQEQNMVQQRQALIQNEQELSRVRQSLQEVEQQLQAKTRALECRARDLEESRQRVVDIQKQYDAQVESNMKRTKDFQERESGWDETNAELVKTKEMLKQERVKSQGARNDLEKAHQQLQQEFDRLREDKQKLEETEVALKRSHEDMLAQKQMTVESHSKVSEELQQLQRELETQTQERDVLRQNLAKANKEIEEISLRYQETQQNLNSKAEQSSHTMQALDKLVEQQKAMEDKHSLEVEEMAKRQQEAETALQASQRSLASREEELQTLRDQAQEQDRALMEARESLGESIDRVEKVTLVKEELEEELTEAKELHRAATVDRDTLKARLEAQLEDAKSKLKKLESSVEDQKNELIQMNLSMERVRWEKEQLESARCELRDKVSEGSRKIGETEQKLEQAREARRAQEEEHRAMQEELEVQLSKARTDLSIKTSENQLLEEYRNKFRELKAQFADLGPAVTERQQQGFHERDVLRVMELEKLRAERDEARIRAEQKEAQLALAQELNEQHLENTNQGTAKIAEEIEKRLQEVEAQRQKAEKEVEQALESVRKRTVEVQVLEMESMQQTEKIQSLEQSLDAERTRIAKLEGALAEKQQSLEEEKMLRDGQDEEVEATKQKLKQEHLVAQRQLLMKMKVEQQEQVRRQELAQHGKTMALMEGLATENGKLMEQVRDLGMVNERMMKHQNSKQKLQYHVKIKQENNELRIENQRLMYKAIELEERLGNKENVESLRKQVREMHGNSSYQHGSLVDLPSTDLFVETNFGDDDEDPVKMEFDRADSYEVSMPRSTSGTPPASSSAPSITSASPAKSVKSESGRPQPTRASNVTSRKRTAAVASSTVGGDGAGTTTYRKRFASVAPTSSTSTTVRPRAISVAPTSSSSVTMTTSTADIPLGPRARAKAASEAAFAASKVMGRHRSATPGPVMRGTTPLPSSSSSSSSSSKPVVSKPVAATSSEAKPRFQRVTQAAANRTIHADQLRGARGGGVTKPVMSRPVSASGSGRMNQVMLEALKEGTKETKRVANDEDKTES
ncbi:Kinesin-like protein kif15 [Podila minutissima]|uniref:Kinesin-like protein kif15 n=1 Tax=Podila minutissima TaxID=64525 RepID=A0A9P5SN74_9FUNG|nr:Kinesin-like protein kif15 [Podila minutissima]